MKKIVFLLFTGILFFVCTGNIFSPKNDKRPFEPALITIHFNKNFPENSMVPSQSIGGAIDGHEQGNIAVMLNPSNIAAMRTAGLKVLSYRLRTELGIEAWHWNSSGRWSDEVNHCGYWVSDTIAHSPIQLSWGYNLPRRGSTFDQANNNGYSRIDDGDSNTFWKSNPYLDSLFTGESNANHEQWVAIDLGKQENVNQLEINWASPYATDLRLEYSNDDCISNFNNVEILNPYEPGIWKPLPISKVHLTHGGKSIIRFSNLPFQLRVLRLVFTRSSHTALPESSDKRDSCGYAIREIKIGVSDNIGFTNFVRYGKSNKTQSVVFTSTTDLWHSENDKDLNIEQPGIDFIFKTGLVGSQPSLFAAGLVYDVPENSKALLTYLRNKYAVGGFELGEEPDGQYISPKDFTELYTQFAKQIKCSYPDVPVGGPSFEGLTENGNEIKSWPSDFVNCLKEKHALNLLQFLSFEWYPFDNFCKLSSPQILQEPQMLKKAMNKLEEILPKNFPIYITESGYSVLGAEPELRMEGALLNADVTGQFFALGGAKIFIYGWEPSYLMNETTACGGYGNLEFFGLNDSGNIKFSTGLYLSTRLFKQIWAQPEDKPVKVYTAESNIKDKEGNEIITAYPLYGPDGKWSVMLINKDESKSYHARININDVMNGKIKPFSMDADLYQFSEKEYKWKADGANGHPERSNMPQPVSLYDGKTDGIDLPPFSITIIKQR